MLAAQAHFLLSLCSLPYVWSMNVQDSSEIGEAQTNALDVLNLVYVQHSAWAVHNSSHNSGSHWPRSGFSQASRVCGGTVLDQFSQRHHGVLCGSMQGRGILHVPGQTRLQKWRP